MDNFIYVAYFLCLILGIIIGYVVANNPSSRLSFQNRGEALVSSVLQSHFNSHNYHLLNHITLPHRGITTQIDHILVSRFGIFVIETKDYNGWIFANADHDTWTQVFFRAKFKFRNPIRQNYAHVQAVRELLDFLPATTIKSIVVFVGDAQFKTATPQGVYSLPEMINYLKSCTVEELSLNRVQFCVGRLETTRFAITQETDLVHVQVLHREHG